MSKILCLVFGHKWYYTGSFNKSAEVGRVCQRCFERQWCTDVNSPGYGNQKWVTMERHPPIPTEKSEE